MGHLFQIFSLIFNLHDYENKTPANQNFLKMWYNQSIIVAIPTDHSQSWLTLVYKKYTGLHCSSESPYRSVQSGWVAFLFKKKKSNLLLSENSQKDVLTRNYFKEEDSYSKDCG